MYPGSLLSVEYHGGRFVLFEGTYPVNHWYALFLSLKEIEMLLKVFQDMIDDGIDTATMRHNMSFWLLTGIQIPF